MSELVLGRTVVEENDASAVAVDTSDLVTHGVIVGMTGSGKTGLGIGLIEETLAAGVPTLLLDPKGDLTNLALVFASLEGREFQPWVDAAQAASAGLTVEEFADGQAKTWRDGLAGWEIGPQQMAEFKAAFGLTIYTPGSTAGVPLNVLGSLQAPQSDDPEVIADEIEGYVTSLLSVVGISADPLSSREHILLSNIIDNAWSAGEDLDLAGLLARVQQPPMRKLGVFELDQFFPPNDRTAFAMKLNGVLAAPSFASWIAGDPIDIQKMLWAEDGTPQCAVITTSHLSDEQRQSASALILSKLVTWMRRQSGTTDLRVLVYMDEVAGYLPPTANPPTKKPIMTLMKQARAFGVGVVLSTQNPVDVDYKALSNAGTWMIGRLTTERDKSRLLDGMSSSAGGVDTAAVADAISGLAKRQFLVRKAGRNEIESFRTRWVRSYLRGPLTKDQIGQVASGSGSQRTVGDAAGQASTENASQDEQAAAIGGPSPQTGGQAAQTTAAGALELSHDETPVMPVVAEGTTLAYLDPGAPWTDQFGLVMPTGAPPRLEAGAVARVEMAYRDAKADVDAHQEFEAVLFPLPAATSALVPTLVDYDDRDLVGQAPQAARYVVPEAKIANKTYWRDLERHLVDHLVRTQPLQLLRNPELKLYSRPGESEAEFSARCSQAAEAEADKRVAALQSKFDTKLRSLQRRLDTASTQASRAEAARNSSVMTGVGSVLGGFLGGRRSASSISAAARRAQTAADRASQASAKVQDLHGDLADVEAQLVDEVHAVTSEWQLKAAAIEAVEVAARKADVRVLDLRLVWMPTA